MVRVIGYVVQFALECTVLTAIATAQSASGNHKERLGGLLKYYEREAA